MFASSNSLAQRKWLSAPVNSQGKIKKATATVRLKWPIFGEMVAAEPDPFWKEYWVRASKGKFPFGFSFNGKALFYSYRNKLTKVVFDKDVAHMCQLAKHLYQDKANIHSPRDLKYNEQRKELMYSNIKVEELTSWAKCNLSQKNNLITYYLLELVNDYNLNTKRKAELEQTIKAGINVGAFNEKNIVLQDNKINNIEGLEYNKTSAKFYINPDIAPPKIKKPSKNSSIKGDEFCLFSNWLKLNAIKTSNRDKIVEICIDDIDDSISSSYYKNDEPE